MNPIKVSFKTGLFLETIENFLEPTYLKIVIEKKKACFYYQNITCTMFIKHEYDEIKTESCFTSHTIYTNAIFFIGHLKGGFKGKWDMNIYNEYIVLVDVDSHFKTELRIDLIDDQQLNMIDIDHAIEKIKQMNHSIVIKSYPLFFSEIVSVIKNPKENLSVKIEIAEDKMIICGKMDYENKIYKKITVVGNKEKEFQIIHKELKHISDWFDIKLLERSFLNGKGLYKSCEVQMSRDEQGPAPLYIYKTAKYGSLCIMIAGKDME